MPPTMRARVVRIGKSKGIPIPKVWLDRLGLVDEVELAVHGDDLIIRRPRHPRDGWAQAFAAMAAHGDDALLDTPAESAWDAKEWEW